MRKFFTNFFFIKIAIFLFTLFTLSGCNENAKEEKEANTVNTEVKADDGLTYEEKIRQAREEMLNEQDSSADSIVQKILKEQNAQ